MPWTEKDERNTSSPSWNLSWLPRTFGHALGEIARCFYYFFMILVVISYKPKATAVRTLTFIVRIFVNDTIAIAVWTSIPVCLEVERS
jgi:hypothetical protein